MSVKLYEVIVDETDKIDFISLVDDPAIEKTFIAMSAERTPLKLLSEEKRLVSGPVLIPRQKILRNIDGDAAYIMFSESTIERLAFATMKDLPNKISMTNINHDSSQKIDISKAYVVESWLTKDAGELPKGTWMVTMKIEDSATWDLIKSGELSGFSIEATLPLFQVSEVDANVNEKLPATLQREKKTTSKKAPKLYVEAEWSKMMNDIESLLRL